MHRHPASLSRALSALCALSALAVFALSGCSSHASKPGTVGASESSDAQSAASVTSTPPPAPPTTPLPPPQALTDVLGRLADPNVPGANKLNLVEGATPDSAATIDKFANALRDNGYQ